jgi:hypothetical protein
VTVTATKIDSLHESGKNFITWAWPASTTIIYNNPVCLILHINYDGQQYYKKIIIHYSSPVLLNTPEQRPALNDLFVYTHYQVFVKLFNLLRLSTV